jgi:nucleotide-binding universal stress UspA family protein
MKITRILCPVDFSDTSRKALRFAGAIATWYEAVLHVVHIVPDPEVSAAVTASVVPAEVIAQTRAAANAALRSFAEDANLSAPIAGLCVRIGQSVEGILEYATDMKPDLIVMGTHGRSALSNLVMGSTAERVVSQAPCPVLTIPRDAREVTSPALVQFKRILCASDFSPASEHAAAYAGSLAQENDARLTFLHVVETLSDDEALAAADQRVIEYVDRRKLDALDSLRKLSARDACEACETGERVEFGAPARTILRVASEIHADLIVMGAQGCGAVGRMFFGSATQTVLRRANCPVLTARESTIQGEQP